MARKKLIKFRSNLEARIAERLRSHKIPFGYEVIKIPYQRPISHYTADILLNNGIIVEIKGRFVASDRAKHLLIKAQHPELDIRFVFSNPNERISKASRTTYGDWCDKHGFTYAAHFIPIEWTRERKNTA